MNDFWQMLHRLFPTAPRVEKRTDNFNRPCGYNVAITVPESRSMPEGDEIICRLPDGLDDDKARRAQFISAIPEMVDRLGDHCQYCADCDWMDNPDQKCSFGQLWKKMKELPK